MTYEKFVPKPWGRYNGVPTEVWARLRPRDSCRLYLATPFDSFWYLGERLAHQTEWDRLTVPVDPPRVLFVQMPDPNVRRLQYFEGLSGDLLLPELDYGVFSLLLASRSIEAYVPDMVHQPPELFDEVEYEYEGTRHTVTLLEVPMMVVDYGMDSWSSRVKKVAGNPPGRYGGRRTAGGSWRPVGLWSCASLALRRSG